MDDILDINSKTRIAEICRELQDEGYFVDWRIDFQDRFKHNYHDIYNYFDIVAIKKNTTRLIKVILGKAVAIDRLKYYKYSIAQRFSDMGDISIEIWTSFDRTVKYKLIDGEWYKLKIIGEAKYADLNNPRIVKYMLFSEPGVMIFSEASAFFIPSDELYNNFEKFLNDIGYSEGKRLIISVKDDKVMVRCYAPRKVISRRHTEDTANAPQ
ncbi:MAG: hypothetical protein ACP5MW_06760 [Thermoplasmata archaeon]